MKIEEVNIKQFKKILKEIGGDINIYSDDINGWRPDSIMTLLNIFKTDVNIISVVDHRDFAFGGKFTLENIKTNVDSDGSIKAICTYSGCIDARILAYSSYEEFVAELIIYDGDNLYGNKKNKRCTIRFKFDESYFLKCESIFNVVMYEYKKKLNEHYYEYLESEKIKWCLNKHQEIIKGE